MQAQLAIDFDSARSARDTGMQQAAMHAEIVSEGWSHRAFSALILFAMMQQGGFTSYDFRMAVKETLDAPPTDKAFGPVFSRAAKAGIIRKTGYTQHPERHCSPTPVWEAF